jgi:hypothetical protein
MNLSRAPVRAWADQRKGSSLFLSRIAITIRFLGTDRQFCRQLRLRFFGLGNLTGARVDLGFRWLYVSGRDVGPFEYGGDSLELEGTPPCSFLEAYTSMT